MSMATGAAALTVGPLTQTDLVRYQGASGDFNPLHHDVTAAAAGRRVISPGLLQAGLMDTWLAQVTSNAPVRSFAVRFLTPAYVGDTLTISGSPVEGEPRAVFEIECRNEAGALLLSGRAELA